ncbi:MAG: hypothetical protein PHC66_04755 [Candidatus Nanoarchaeia archaeon]|nr:hypothetical protein [Candidatus Nanoarchaeia archaeon]MDD5238988.1 hypothetical protein [Candidatus Nanoarchaeia archaeon]
MLTDWISDAVQRIKHGKIVEEGNFKKKRDLPKIENLDNAYLTLECVSIVALNERTKIFRNTIETKKPQSGKTLVNLLRNEIKCRGSSFDSMEFHMEHRRKNATDYIQLMGYPADGLLESFQCYGIEIEGYR